MKKLFFVLFVFLFSALCVSAQTENSSNEPSRGLKMEAGFMFNPQGCISLKNPDQGFSQLTTLQAILSIEKGKFKLLPLYSLGDNAAGSYLVYEFCKSADVYLLFTKNIMTTGESYAGIGGDIFLKKGNDNSSIFFEIGQSTPKVIIPGEDEVDLWFCVGLSFSLTKKIL